MKQVIIGALKLALIFSSVFICFVFIAPLKANSAFAENEKPVYAKVETDCPLYKTENTQNTSLSNIYFLIPKSYFVCILNKTQTTCKVRYLNYVGYCDSSLIKEVSFVPNNPYLTNVYFNISLASGTQIRSAPTIENNVLATIPAGAQNLTYIASANGQTPSGGNSNVWYFCQFCPEFNPTMVYTGYVYSERTESAPQIEVNLEAETKSFSDHNTYGISADSEYENVEISSSVKAVLITLICIPIIAIFCIVLIKQKLYKRRQHAMSATTNQNVFNTISEKENSKSEIYKHDVVHAFKNKPLYKKPHTHKSQLLKSKNFSLDDLDDDDNLL